jgi:ParB family chromosome partitioning protein
MKKLEEGMKMEQNNKRKALGKGLEQLFSNESLYVDPIEEIVENAKEDDIVELKINELRSNPYQPRRTFDQEKLQELADSIKEFGVVEPIIVKKSIHGYEIVAGERRCKAARIAGLETVPAVIKEFSDEDMMQIALLENIQREDLTAIEEAEAYANLVGKLGISQEELARRVGKSRSYVTNMIGLLNLPQEVKEFILNGYLSMGHARVLSKLEDEEKVIELAQKVINEQLSVRDLESIASNPDYKRKKAIKVQKTTNEYGFVEEALTDKIGNRVRIQNKKIVIPFNSEKDLERILEILNVEVDAD